MFCVRNEVTDKLRDYIIDFDKSRFKVIVRGGLDDSRFNESTGVDVGRLVDESSCSPVRAVSLVTLVYEDGIVTVGTPYGILVLGDTLVYTCSRFTNILLVAGGAGNSVDTHSTFIGW